MSQTGKVIFSILLTALIVGAGTYYLANRAAQTDKESLEIKVETLEEQIANLESQELIEIEEETATDETEKASLKSEYKLAEEFCLEQAGENSQVSEKVFAENDGGLFVQCSINSTEGVGGYMLIGKKVNGQWQEVWSGNGFMKESIAEKYDLPYIFRNNIAPDEEF
jgi:hypothetical protein